MAKYVKKKCNKGLLIFGLIFGFVFGILYLIYCSIPTKIPEKAPKHSGNLLRLIGAAVGAAFLGFFNLRAQWDEVGIGPIFGWGAFGFYVLVLLLSLLNMKTNKTGSLTASLIFMVLGEVLAVLFSMLGIMFYLIPFVVPGIVAIVGIFMGKQYCNYYTVGVNAGVVDLNKDACCAADADADAATPDGDQE